MQAGHVLLHSGHHMQQQQQQQLQQQHINHGDVGLNEVTLLPRIPLGLMHIGIKNL